MRKRDLCCHPESVCLSVSLSRSWIISTEDIWNFLLGPVAQTAFWLRASVPIRRGTPSAGAQKIRRAKKMRFLIAIFDWSRRLYRKRYEIGSYWTLTISQRRRICVGSDDLEWPWKAGHDGASFQSDLLNNARTVWPRTTKFVRITHVGRSVFLIFYGVRNAPSARALGPSAPQFLNIFIHQCVVERK